MYPWVATMWRVKEVRTKPWVAPHSHSSHPIPSPVPSFLMMVDNQELQGMVLVDKWGEGERRSSQERSESRCGTLFLLKIYEKQVTFPGQSAASQGTLWGGTDCSAPGPTYQMLNTCFPLVSGRVTVLCGLFIYLNFLITCWHLKIVQFQWKFGFLAS